MTILLAIIEPLSPKIAVLQDVLTVAEIFGHPLLKG